MNGLKVNILVKIVEENVQYGSLQHHSSRHNIYTGPVICGQFFLGDSNDGE